MGRNKNLRKQIDSETKQINIHQDKIDREKAKRSPDEYKLSVWYRHLNKHLRIRANLVSKLPGGKK